MRERLPRRFLFSPGAPAKNAKQSRAEARTLFDGQLAVRQGLLVTRTWRTLLPLRRYRFALFHESAELAPAMPTIFHLPT